MKSKIKKYLSIVLIALLLCNTAALGVFSGAVATVENGHTENGNQEDAVSDAGCNKISHMLNAAVISENPLPGFILESDGIPDEYGCIAVDLYAENCVGMTSFNFSLQYDPAVINYDSFVFGADAVAIRSMADNGQMAFNNITFETRNTGTQFRLNGYFGKGLYSTQHFAALNKDNTINSNRFHLARVYFSVVSRKANAQIDATAIFDFEGFAADGFEYEAKGLIHNLTAQMCVAVYCPHDGETQLRNFASETCGADGYSGDTYCLDCDACIRVGTTVPATGIHTWNTGIITLVPGCNKVGETMYTCVVCAQTKTAEIAYDPANHTGEVQIRNAVTATCGTDGYTGDIFCTDCDAKLSVGTIIAATGLHTWDRGVIITAPTYKDYGTKMYTCSVCGNTKTEQTDKLHSAFTDKNGQAVLDADGDIIAVVGTTVGALLAQASEGCVVVDANGQILDADEKNGTGHMLIFPDGTAYSIVVFGDLHGDGKNLADDARTALRNSVGLDELNATQLKAADVDHDGVITAADARAILRVSVKLDNPADWFENYF